MKKYFPSFIFLFLFNSCVLWLCFYFFSTRYFVLSLGLLVVLNIWVLFFSEYFFIKILRLRVALPTEDIYRIWHNENSSSFKSDQCYIASGPGTFSLHFSNGKMNAAVFSENLLELLTKKELESLVCYYKTGFATGWSLFLTLLAFFCAFLWALCFILEAPFRLFLKTKKLKKTPFCFLLFLKLLSLPARWIFLSLDGKPNTSFRTSAGLRFCGKFNPFMNWSSGNFLIGWFLFFLPIP